MQARKLGAPPYNGDIYITKAADEGAQIWCVVWAEKTGQPVESWNSVIGDPEGEHMKNQNRRPNNRRNWKPRRRK